MFGMLSRELGFIVEVIRKQYPDCVAKREMSGRRGVWESVSIEFEFRSSHFQSHGHDAEECDVIVCWEHDWVECPLEVICLRDVVNRV